MEMFFEHIQDHLESVWSHKSQRSAHGPVERKDAIIERKSFTGIRVIHKAMNENQHGNWEGKCDLKSGRALELHKMPSKS